MVHAINALHNNTPPLTSSNNLNSVIQHQANLKNDKAILHTFSKMESLNVSPSSKTLPLILKACSKLRNVELGKRVHDLIKGKELISDVRVRSALVGFYAKCGFLDDARKVFDEMAERDVVLWNAMISGYVGCCCYEEGLILFRKIWGENLRPSVVSLVTVLVACGELLELGLGKEVHGYCLRNGLFFDSGCYLGTALVGFYAKFDVRDSRVVFEMMGAKNVVTWNAMIKGYVNGGYRFEALSLFEEMVVKDIGFDNVTLLVAIQACSELEHVDLGKQLHQLALKYGYAHDPYITNTLITFYSRTNSFESSVKLFEFAPLRDTAMWNTILSVYLEFGRHDEACIAFCRMVSEGFRVSEATFTILLSFCSELNIQSRVVKSLHAAVITRGFYGNTAILNAVMRNYVELDCIQEAVSLFSEMSKPDVLSWNVIIAGLASNGLMRNAWDYFEKMLSSGNKPNSYTVIAVLSVCKNASDINIGRSLHAYVLKLGIEVNVELNTALVEMYMNCADIATGRNLFDRYSNKDVASWNSLISIYVRNSLFEEALPLFGQMISGIEHEPEPNSVTIINILSSCSDIASLPLGQCLHAYTIRRNYFGFLNLSLENALLSMYARCGCMKNAETIFKNMKRRDLSSWNALVAGYGLNGQVIESHQAFSNMLKDGFIPNRRSFLSMLVACSHSGMVEKGLEIFKSMIYDFNLTPMLIHYGCIVDLLGRAQYIAEAEKIINSMPYEPDASVWRALLSACRDSNDPKVGLKTLNIFQKLVEVEPENPGNYVLLSNIYASAGLWSEVGDLRMRLKEKGLGKKPGMSWIFVRNEVHCFVAGDQSFFDAAETYATLDSLVSIMKDDIGIFSF